MLHILRDAYPRLRFLRMHILQAATPDPGRPSPRRPHLPDCDACQRRGRATPKGLERWRQCAAACRHLPAQTGEVLGISASQSSIYHYAGAKYLCPDFNSRGLTGEGKGDNIKEIDQRASL